MRPALTIIVGFLLAAIAPGLSAQTKPAATPQQKPATQPAKPAAAAPAPVQQKPAAQNTAKPPAAAPQKNAGTQTAKPAPKQAAKPAAKTPAAKPPAAKPVKKPATPTRTVSAKKPADATEPAKIARRDPFESLVSRQQSAANAAKNLPPGKAGLQVSTLRVDGIVKATNGMIAVVTNPQSRTYFLREGDRLYDGAVEKISMDGVTFHEEGKDAFGKPVERQVNKRIYSIAGEQQ
jgi:Tfp pilus assembly protein PilP